MADVRASKIDIVLVYKVDRLTRSLADFAKLIELFDANNVSLVSITQSLDTSSTAADLLGDTDFSPKTIQKRVDEGPQTIKGPEDAP